MPFVLDHSRFRAIAPAAVLALVAILGFMAAGIPTIVARPMAHNRSMSMTQAAGATIPATLHVDRAAGTLEIGWQDGHKTAYAAVELRWLCPCAYCRGEAGMPGWLDTSPTLSPEQTRLVDAHLIGDFDEGHQMGRHLPHALLNLVGRNEDVHREVPYYKRRFR